MSFKTFLVDIDKITSKVKRSNFAENELEKLAHSILQLNGIIQPLVLKEIDLEKYEVIEGDFQYYGALKAWEIDDDFEMIRGFVVNEKENNLVAEQLKLLAGLNNQQLKLTPTPIITDTNSDNNLSPLIDNLENRLDKLIIDFDSKITEKTKELDIQINQMREQLPSKLEVLSAFNELSAEKLILPLKTAGINEKEINNIISFVNRERKKKPFESLTDLIERSKIKQGKRNVKLITEGKLIKMMDRWRDIGFYGV